MTTANLSKKSNTSTNALCEHNKKFVTVENEMRYFLIYAFFSRCFLHLSEHSSYSIMAYGYYISRYAVIDLNTANERKKKVARTSHEEKIALFHAQMDFIRARN